MAWAPPYLTLSEAKAYLRIADTVDDAEITVAIEAASRSIDEHCNRQFGQVDEVEERVYTARWDYHRNRWVVDIDDLDDADELTVTVAGAALTEFTLEPVNAVVKGLVWTRLVVSPDAAVQPCGRENEVAVVAPWGWSGMPVTVASACRLQTARFFSRRNSPYGVAGSPDQGSELRLLSRVDPDVGVMLRRYVKPRRVG
jgi:Phage gp6-like head-tail connector protein